MEEDLSYIKEGDVPGHVKHTNLDTLLLIAKQMQESVCKIYGTKLNGTGFFCMIQNMKEWNSSFLYVLMTNNHVLGEEDIKSNKKINISLNNEKIKKEITIDEKRKTFTSEKYDVTIIEMKPTDGIKLDSFMEIDKDIYKDNYKEIFKNKSIYLLHYPKGAEICKSEEVIKNIGDNYTIIHCCDSNNGSSGGPLINLKNNKVIGIHKGYNIIKKINLGTILKEPIENFYEQQNNDNNQINKDVNKNKEQKLDANNGTNETINNNLNEDKQQKLNTNNNTLETTNNLKSNDEFITKSNKLKYINNNSGLNNIKYKNLSIIEKDMLNKNEKSEARKNGFLLFGYAGVGKSTLLNAIFGKEVCSVGCSVDGITKECKILYYKLDNGKCISFIDIPGIKDITHDTETENYNENIYAKIYDYLKENNINLKGLIFLINFLNERFDAIEQDALLSLNKLFPVKRFWKNLIIIFTHCYACPDGDTVEEMMESRNNTNREIFCRIMDKVKNISDKIDYNDLIIKYFNSFWPIKNEKKKEANIKVRNELEEVLNILINRESLMDNTFQECKQNSNVPYESKENKNCLLF